MPAAGERRLSRADQKVIDLLAAPLAIVMHAQALTEDLKASRERVIDAAEEERARLRRELHDSLGPLLTGAAFKADSIALPPRTGQSGPNRWRSTWPISYGSPSKRCGNSRTDSAQPHWTSSGWSGHCEKRALGSAPSR